MTPPPVLGVLNTCPTYRDAIMNEALFEKETDLISDFETAALLTTLPLVAMRESSMESTLFQEKSIRMDKRS